jgi:peptidoglycan/xylan/chitin deacetylase (PgdA/CDA1 family)
MIASAAKRAVRAGLGFSLQALGLLQALERARSGRWPRILYYHGVTTDRAAAYIGISVSAANFERQMRHLVERYTVVPLEQLLDDWMSGRQPNPREVAVTFDDGYRDNYDNAYPVLMKYRVPATIFLTTAFIGSSSLLWWDRVTALLTGARSRGVARIALRASLPQSLRSLVNAFLESGTKATLATTVNELKRLGRGGRIQAIDAIAAALGDLSADAPDRMFLNWDEVREMARNGISFGSHTHTHAVLPELTSDEAEDEMTLSKRLIETAIGMPVRMLAYPDGCFSEGTKKLANEVGFDYALQTRRNLQGHGRDPYAIPRIRIEEAHSLNARGRFSASAFSLEVSDLSNYLLLRDLRQQNPYAS